MRREKRRSTAGDKSARELERSTRKQSERQGVGNRAELIETVRASPSNLNAHSVSERYGDFPNRDFVL